MRILFLVCPQLHMIGHTLTCRDDAGEVEPPCKSIRVFSHWQFTQSASSNCVQLEYMYSGFSTS